MCWRSIFTKVWGFTCLVLDCIHAEFFFGWFSPHFAFPAFHSQLQRHAQMKVVLPMMCFLLAGLPQHPCSFCYNLRKLYCIFLLLTNLAALCPLNLFYSPSDSQLSEGTRDILSRARQELAAWVIFRWVLLHLFLHLHYVLFTLLWL